MAPTNPMNNKLNVTPGSIIFFSKFSRRFNRNVVLSYIKNVLFSQKRFTVSRPPRLVLSALIDHISHIILIISKPKMIWINTLSIIARMTNKQCRQFTFKNKPRSPMCINHFTIETESSISRPARYTSMPNPTSRCYSHFCKKSIFYCHNYIITREVSNL